MSEQSLLAQRATHLPSPYHRKHIHCVRANGPNDNRCDSILEGQSQSLIDHTGDEARIGPGGVSPPHQRRRMRSLVYPPLPLARAVLVGFTTAYREDLFEKCVARIGP